MEHTCHYVEGAGIPSIEYMSLCGGDGKLECLCGKAAVSCVCDGSTHSSGCVVNGSIIVYIHTKKNCIVCTERELVYMYHRLNTCNTHT